VARNYRSVITFFQHALMGLLAGAALGAIASVLFMAVAPARFAATVALFHMPEATMPGSGRDFLALYLDQPNFFWDVANAHKWPAKTTALLEKNIAVVATDASRPRADIRLTGTDEVELARTLDEIADHKVDAHRSRQQSN
jgi:hypothetical protein